MKRLALTCLAVLTAGSLVAQERGADNTNQTKTRTTVRMNASSDRADRNDFVMPRRTQKASDLMGKKVVNVSNEDLGKIEDIVVDASNGRILYGVLSFGGFLGMGDKLFAIPWESLTLPSDAKNLVLNVDKDRLKNAEGFDKQNWPNFADRQWATKTYSYYERTPYWQASDSGSAESADQDRARKQARSRWNEPVSMWQKCSDLCGKDIHNVQNEDLGRISDCLIDPDSGRVIYGVLSNGGNLYAIPWNALSLTTDAKRFQIDLSKEQLKKAPAFSNDSWPDATNERWAVEVHHYYHVQPYWTVTVESREKP